MGDRDKEECMRRGDKETSQRVSHPTQNLKCVGGLGFGLSGQSGISDRSQTSEDRF